MGELDWGPGAVQCLVQLHKSFGITVLLLSVARIVWRLMNRPPAGTADGGVAGLGLAGRAHSLLCADHRDAADGLDHGVASRMRPRAISASSISACPASPALDPATREGIEEGFEQVHGNLAWVIIGLACPPRGRRAEAPLHRQGRTAGAHGAGRVRAHGGAARRWTWRILGGGRSGAGVCSRRGAARLRVRRRRRAPPLWMARRRSFPMRWRGTSIMGRARSASASPIWAPAL